MVGKLGRGGERGLGELGLDGGKVQASLEDSEAGLDNRSEALLLGLLRAEDRQEELAVALAGRTERVEDALERSGGSGL